MSIYYPPLDSWNCMPTINYFEKEEKMIDYCEPYLKIQKLIKEYHTATLKNQFEKATKIAHELADETIRLEIASIKQLKNQWINQ